MKNEICGAQKHCEACLLFSKLMRCYCCIYCFKRHENAEGKQNVLGSFGDGFLPWATVSIQRMGTAPMPRCAGQPGHLPLVQCSCPLDEISSHKTHSRKSDWVCPFPLVLSETWVCRLGWVDWTPPCLEECLGVFWKLYLNICYAFFWSFLKQHSVMRHTQAGHCYALCAVIKFHHYLTGSLVTLHSPVHLLIPTLHFILYVCEHLYSPSRAEIRVHGYLNVLGNSPNTGFKGTVVVSMTYCAGKSEAEK